MSHVTLPRMRECSPAPTLIAQNKRSLHSNIPHILGGANLVCDFNIKVLQIIDYVIMTYINIINEGNITIALFFSVSRFVWFP
jgi:hypothetical protein